MPLRIVVTLCLIAFSCLGSHAQSTGCVAVPGTSNPFLAGQPAGTTSKGDSAPAQSPALAPIPIVGGLTYRFPTIQGFTNFVPGFGTIPAEGGMSVVFSSADLGISSYDAPVSSLIGVFMPNGVNPGAAPVGLSFTSQSQRDFASLSPALYQTFFIGNGRRNDFVTLQNFVAPAGATRLFLGTADGTGWNDNVGQLSVRILQGNATLASSTSLGPGCATSALVFGAAPPPLCMDMFIGVRGATSIATTSYLCVSLPPAAPTPLGGGCTLYFDVATFDATEMPLLGGGWTLNVPVPDVAALLGQQFVCQVVVLPTTGLFGVDLTEGFIATLGY